MDPPPRSQGSHLARNRASAEKRVRSRAGCFNCRRKRRKCDEVRPRCAGCHQKDEFCEWGLRLSFRPENAQSIPESHPSMMIDALNKCSRKYRILNVTPEVVRDYWHETDKSPNGTTYRLETATPQAEELADGGVEEFDDDDDDDNEPDPPAPFASPTAMQTVQVDRNMAQGSPTSARPYYHEPYLETHDTAIVSPESYRSQELDITSFTSPSIMNHTTPESAATPHSHTITEYAAAHLLALRNTISHAPVMTPGVEQLPTSHPVIDHIHLDPIFDAGINDVTFDDGIFLPGSTYQELHTTLRNHIFNTARSIAPTRHGSPVNGVEFGTIPEQGAQQGFVTAATNLIERNQQNNITPRAPELSQHEEYELWKNWTDEVAPWLDKFDNQCHFGQKLPPLAKSHSHLRFSILALSARQLERKNPTRPSSGSLALYQEAIHQLLPELQSRNTAVIASCVVLCVLEMMSCSPKEWRRHLDGCASLIQSVGINGFSGGVEQALFWCFARMDVCGGLISSERTLIPVEAWTVQPNLAEDKILFQNSPSYDLYASYAEYLCAQVLELLASRSMNDHDSDRHYVKRWSELFELIEDWYANRPEEMTSILYLPSSHEDHSRPFPILLYSNAPAISGNQMYHTTAILMLQKQPRGVVCRRKPRSILWHARRICAISISNTHHGCWTNCVQPLWIAGQLMSHPVEHRAIIETYKLIEQETGWGTEWRIDDLKAFWGELDD